MTTLGKITSKDGNLTEIRELDSISYVIHKGKSKASGLAIVNNVRNGIKLLNFRSVTVFASDLA